MENIDLFFDQFLTFKVTYDECKSTDLSESDTRSKVIDKVFIDTLGWNELDFQREGHGENGFYDYRFYTSRFHFLVEAKKNFADFKLPTNHRYSFLNILQKGNSEVIDQMRKYLFDQSLQYGVITNGHQFIIAKFVNCDGSDWKKTNAFFLMGFQISKKILSFSTIYFQKVLLLRIME